MVGEDRLEPGLQMVLPAMQVAPTVDDSRTPAPPWDIPDQGKLPRGQNFRQCTWLCTWLEGEAAGCVVIHRLTSAAHGLAGWSGTRKDHDWKTGDKEIWDEENGKTPLNGGTV